MGGPEMAPQTPHSLVAPRETRGGPRSPACSLVAPRETRGAPRSPARSLVAPRETRGAPRSPAHSLVAPRETRGAPRSPATFYIYTRLPGLIAWLPVLQSGHDSGGH